MASVEEKPGLSKRSRDAENLDTDVKTNPAGSKTKGAPSASAKGGDKSQDDSQIGNALRSVYQQTIGENIPPEMLDLLSKLD